MNRGVLFSVLLLFSWGSSFSLQGQGALVFSNIGEGISGRVFGFDFGGQSWGLGVQYPSELSQHSAELSLTNGIRIAGPTPFLGDGLFDGGVSIISGIPPGEKLRVFVAVLDSDGEIVGVSAEFNVVLGGVDVATSPPGRLTELIDFHTSTLYYWDGWEFNPVRRRCVAKSPVIAGTLVDEIYCIGQDERLARGKSSFQSLEYSFGDNGELTIRWLAGGPLILFKSRSLAVPEVERVDSDIYENGYRVLTVSASEPQQFYWLAESGSPAN